jgi:ABC-2 type transport system permease protein
MRGVLAIAAGVMRLELRDRSTFFWMLIMPMAFVFIFGGMFRPEVARKTSLTVIDEDGSFLSRGFIDALGSERVALTVLTPAQRDSAAKGVRTLEIPRGFSDSLVAGRRVALKLETGKGNADYDLSAEVYVYKAIARLLAMLAEIDTVADEHTLPVNSAAFTGRFAELRARPELVTTRVSTAGKGRAAPSGIGGSAQSMLVFFLLMNTTISGAVVLTQEKQSRVLARIATLPIRYGELLAGKALGLLGLAVLQALIVVGLAGSLFHVYWGPSLPALAILLICYGLAAAALGIFLGGLLRTPEQAGAVGWIVPLFLGAIGGTWWPLEVVPPWMRAVGHISPAAWALEGMHGLINFGQGASAVLAPSLVLLGFAAVLTAVGAKSLRTGE